MYLDTATPNWYSTSIYIVCSAGGGGGGGGFLKIPNTPQTRISTRAHNRADNKTYSSRHGSNVNNVKYHEQILHNNMLHTWLENLELGRLHITNK